MKVSSHAKSRPSWGDRFRAPDAESLVESLPRHQVPAFEHARERLRSVGGVRETLGWHGVWNWSFAFRHNGDSDPAVAYLVPDPSRPRLCVTFPDDRIGELPVKKLSKAVRDTLAHAPTVDGVRWPTWEIHSKAQVDEILALMEYRVASSVTAS